MAGPRPVPPNLRVVDESACEKDWNRRHMTWGDANSGVADSELDLVLSLAFLYGQHYLALIGELDGIAEQVDHDLAQAGDIAADTGRNIVIDDVGDVQTLFDGALPSGPGRIRHTRAGRRAGTPLPSCRLRSC